MANSLPMLENLASRLAGLPKVVRVYTFPPPFDNPIEKRSWILDADMTFRDDENHRLETWTFTMDYWVGPSTSEKDTLWKEAWQMRDNCIEHFGTPDNWSLGGTVNNLRLHVGDDTIRQMMHGEAIWIVLCLKLETLRVVRHGE